MVKLLSTWKYIQQERKSPTLSRRKDVQIQTVFALVLQQRQQSFEVLQAAFGHSFQRCCLVWNVRQLLGANWPHFIRNSNSVPRRWSSCWAETIRLDGRSSVGHPQKHLQESVYRAIRFNHRSWNKLHRHKYLSVGIDGKSCRNGTSRTKGVSYRPQRNTFN